MIVTCPSCSTRYLVDPRALGATGRTVRCAHCAHTWHQAPVKDAPRPLDLEPPRPSPFSAPPSFTEPEPFTPPSESFADHLPAPEPERVRPGLPALSRKRQIPWMGVGWGALAVVVLVGLFGVFYEKDQIVEWWPPSARLYLALGQTVELPGDGLQLRKVLPSRDTENGLPTLVIQGEIANVSDIARKVPKVKVVLRDSSDHELQSWSFTVTDDRLQPGATVPFRTSISQPSEAATGLLVAFVVPGN